MARPGLRTPTTLRELLKRHKAGVVLGGFRSQGQFMNLDVTGGLARRHARCSRTIAVVNQKGGCGKTTTAINLAAFLAAEHRRTLVVDADPQGHATLGLVRALDAHADTIHDVFKRHTSSRQPQGRIVVQSVCEDLNLVPADIRLSTAPALMAKIAGRENVLAGFLDDLKAAYDYIIIDCPPNVGLLTFNALKAASEVIVPVDPSFFSLQGLGKLMETLDVVANSTAHRVALRAVVTMYPGRCRFAREVVDNIRQRLGARCFNTVVRRSVKLAEASSHGVPINRYCDRCAGFADYASLAGEVLEMEGTC